LAFIIRIYNDAQSSECQIIKMWLTCCEGTVLEYGQSAVWYSPIIWSGHPV